MTLSKKYHPDRHGQSSKYVQIQRAYEILSKRTKKIIFDTDGLSEVRKYEHALENGYVDRRYNKVKAKVRTVIIDLKQAFLGSKKTFSVSRKTVCRKCQATGALGGELKVCPHCRGKGVSFQTIRTSMGVMQMQNTCEHCGGRGKYPKKTCPICRGHKSHNETKSFTVDIEKGVEDEHKVVFEGEGDAVPTAIPGDIVFRIKIRKNPKFERKGDDLYTKISILFEEALMGFKTTIEHLDGKIVDIMKEGTSQPKELLKIDGKGMPKHDLPLEYGDMYVEINFELPKKIRLSQKKLIRAIFK